MGSSFHNSSVSSRRYQQGLSLIELMISITLGLVIIAGVIGVYLESKRNYASEEEIARMQENGRFTLNLLARELMMAGFFGGTLKSDEVTAVAVSSDCASSWALDIADPIDFINYDSSASVETTRGTTLACVTAADIQPNTDILTIKRTAGEPTLRLGEKAASLSSSPSSVDQWYLRYVGYGDEIAWVTESPQDISNLSSPPKDVAYWEAHTRVFYIRSYSEAAGDGIPTLCESALVGNGMSPPRCLVEGIEEMHVEFGVDTDVDSIPDRYLADPSGTDLDTALVARVYLLVRSLQQVPGYQNTKTYQLGSRAVPAKNDGYLRRVFSTTVQVRNAALPVG